MITCLCLVILFTNLILISTNQSIWSQTKLLSLITIVTWWLCCEKSSGHQSFSFLNSLDSTFICRKFHCSCQKYQPPGASLGESKRMRKVNRIHTHKCLYLMLRQTVKLLSISVWIKVVDRLTSCSLWFFSGFVFVPIEMKEKGFKCILLPLNRWASSTISGLCAKLS